MIPAMSENLEAPVKRLFSSGFCATLSIPREDGTVQAAVVWCDVDDQGRLAVNSAEGRAWPKNLRRAKTATLTAFDPANPYEFASVTCSLAEDTHEGAREEIDALAKLYMGLDEYPFHQPGEQRISFRLQPERVFHMAPRG
jgi:PPOX class probable F420-dependent enzyme